MKPLQPGTRNPELETRNPELEFVGPRITWRRGAATIPKPLIFTTDFTDSIWIKTNTKDQRNLRLK
jgi:hypothetical protein